MNMQPTLHTIETIPCGASDVESLSTAGLKTKRRWLWVRCAGESGPLSSETHVWCSYQSPADVYRLLAEMVQSGVIIREVRKLSPDMRTWPIDGVVGTGTIVVVEPDGAGQSENAELVTWHV